MAAPSWPSRNSVAGPFLPAIMAPFPGATIKLPLNEAERRDFWDICEDHYQTRSTILTSQLPVTRWHEQIGDPTAADGILDRLVHNAHRIEMRGDSMRKKRGTQPPS
jgi:DNA replication protein DnaC